MCLRAWGIDVLRTFALVASCKVLIHGEPEAFDHAPSVDDPNFCNTKLTRGRRSSRAHKARLPYCPGLRGQLSSLAERALLINVKGEAQHGCTSGNSNTRSPICVIRNTSLPSVSSSSTAGSTTYTGEMDQGDCSEVKELITSNPSSSFSASQFDGDTAVFYKASSKLDEMFLQKSGDPRSFGKLGAEITGRQGIKVGYNNQRSEKDTSSWAIVHEVGHALHFSESAVDIAFVTKNALALRDAQSMESQTAPFKSVHCPSAEKLAVDELKRKQQNPNIPESIRTGNGTQSADPGTNCGASNIFSFNSSREVAKAATDADPYDYDSNFEKDSTASFDFNRAGGHRSAVTMVGPLTKPSPSKWDDAEKWLSAGDAPAKLRAKNSPVSAAKIGSATAPSRKLDAFGPTEPTSDTTAGTDPCVDVLSSSVENSIGDSLSPQNCKNFLGADCTKKVDVPRKGFRQFAFLPAGKPVPLPLPAVPIDRYPLEDVYSRDASSAKESSLYLEAGIGDTFPLRTVKPTSDEHITETKNPASRNTEEAGDPSAPTPAGPLDSPTSVVNMRTVCMRDMGTEMTPIASVEPSRTATPLRATTPNLGSPANSRPSTPGRSRPAFNPTPTISGSDCHDNMEARSKPALTGKELQVKTRQEILALGTQLGKVNIAAWATKEEEEADAAQALKASLELKEVRKNLLATRAAAWEEAEQAKYTSRYKREEAKIQAWENHEKAKAEAEMRRIEVKVERMRSHANEKLMNKLAAARRQAEDLRAKAEALRCEQASRTASRANHIRRNGKIPTSFLGQLCR